MKQELSQESLEQFPLSTTKPPRGWSTVLLTDIASEITPGFASGKHDSHGGGQPHLRPMNVDRSGQIDLAVVKFVPPNEDRVLSAGDILFNNTNSPELVGKTAVVGRREHGFAYSNHMTRIRVDSGISLSFVARQLHFLWMSGYMKHRCTNHVNQASISSKTLAHTVPLLLPPSSEQDRIVEKLEELLSDLDAGVAELKAAQHKLAQYRQSLLKAAVEGALTADWRAARARSGEPQESGADLLQRILTERRARWEAKQLAKYAEQGKTPPKGWQAKYPSPFEPKSVGLPTLPEGWVWASLDQLTDKIVDGTHHTPTYKQSGIPFISVKDIRHGEISFDACKYISEDEHNELTKRCHPEPGDLLVTKSGTIGRTAIVRAGRYFSLFVSVALLKPASSRVDTQWMDCAFSAWFQSINVANEVKGTAVKNLHLEDFRELVLPLPPSEEQALILDTFSRHWADVANLLLSLEQSFKQAAAQRKNILKAAFAGQLVPQDPHDEPASALLERIRASQVAKAAKGRDKAGRKRKETS